MQAKGRALRAGVGALVVVASWAASAPAWACATCGCTLSKDWLGGQAMGSAGWTIGLSYDFIDQNQFHQGTSDLSKAQAEQILNSGSNANPGTAATAGNEVETQTLTRTTTLNLDYNAQDWGISVQLPFVSRYHQTYHQGLGQTPSDAIAGAPYDMSDVNALGDLRVISRFALTEDGRIGVTAGLKLPTGQTNSVFAISGQAIDPSLQAGTGSTDIILGGYAAAQVEDFGFFGQAQWQHALVSQAPAPGANYRPGDAWTVTAGTRWAPLGQMVVPLLQFNYVHRNIDDGPGASREFDGTPQSGGDLIYAAPGVSVLFGNGLRAYAYVQLPLYENVSGVQLTPKAIFSFGIRKSF